MISYHLLSWLSSIAPHQQKIAPTNMHQTTSHQTTQQRACRNQILNECNFGCWYNQHKLSLVIDLVPTETLTLVIEQADFGCVFWELNETDAGETEWLWYFLLIEPAFCPEAVSRIPGLKTWLLYEIRLSWKQINRIDL